MKIEQTRWYGIYIQQDEQGFWIVDDNGGDQYMGNTPPTDSQVEQYRNTVIS